MITAGQVAEITGTITLTDGATTDFTLYVDPSDTSTKWAQYKTRGAEPGRFVDTLDRLWAAGMDARLEAEAEIEGCEGHESLDGANMGQSTYCGGSCR